jgi:nucleoside-diphosphate-sugar epimerase
MKIAITGHTQGLGQAFFNHFQSHTVIGFSRSNGYNIASPADRNKILEELIN